MQGFAKSALGASLLFIVAFALQLTGCGSSSPSPSNSPAPSPSISVSISPTTSSVQVSHAQSFTATVSNDAKNKGVTWSLSGASCNGAICGSLSAASSASGTPITYMAPASIPAAPTISITATSMSDNMRSASATITVAASNISVSLTPARGGIAVGQSLNFAATVANDVNSDGVTWSATAGSFKNQTAASAVYVAPSSAGAITVTATSVADTAKLASATVGVTDLAGVLTYHNDVSRMGVNAQEYALTKQNVTTAAFGRLFSCAVDGAIYTQPLWVANLSINGGTHNVVLAATQHDTVYAFDADARPCTTYWQTGANGVNSLMPSGETWVTSADESGCQLIIPDIGILGTPVIDAATATLYLVTSTKSTSAATFHQRLHALDLVTGSEKFGGPTEIQAMVAGTGAGSSAGQVHFDPMLNAQRPALLLQNGHVFISWASYCDFGNYHGWLMAYNAASLMQEAVFNVSPNASAGGIWMSGSGPSADASGNVYLSTGNGAWNGTDAFGDSILKFQVLTATSPSLTVADYFTPHEQASLDTNDVDLGSGGVLLLPDSAGVSGHPHLLVQAGRTGSVYLVDRDNMGHFCSPCTTTDTQIVQDLSGALTGLWASPTYWNGNLYFGETDETANLKFLQAFSLGPTGPNFISTNPTSTTANTFTYTYPGPTGSISTDGSGKAIFWAIDSTAFGTTEGISRAAGPAILYAFDANNLAIEMWNSAQAPGSRDIAGFAVRFTVPTVANGKVYIGTRGNDDTLGHGTVFGELDVYGLLPN